MSPQLCQCGAIVEAGWRACPACSAANLPRPTERPSAAAGEAWYSMIDGRMSGPSDLSALLASFRSGELAADCQVWSPGLKEWTTLAELASRQPRPRTSTTSNATPAASEPFPRTRVPSPDASGPAGGPIEGVNGSGPRVEAFMREPEAQEASRTQEASGVQEASEAPKATGGQAETIREDRGGGASARERRARGSSTTRSAALTLSRAAWQTDATATPIPGYVDFEGIEVGRIQRVSKPKPWHRWFARVLDTTLAALALGIVTATIAPGSGLLENSITAPVLIVGAWLIVESFILARFGTTPGKALLNIKLTRANGRRLTLRQAFERSGRVWFFGMAGGVAILNLVTLAISYGQLTRDGVARWDRDGSFVVSHEPLGKGRLAGIAVCGVLYVVLMILSTIPA